jgi:hypothetical protein
MLQHQNKLGRFEKATFLSWAKFLELRLTTYFLVI